MVRAASALDPMSVALLTDGWLLRVVLCSGPRSARRRSKKRPHARLTAWRCRCDGKHTQSWQHHNMPAHPQQVEAHLCTVLRPC